MESYDRKIVTGETPLSFRKGHEVLDPVRSRLSEAEVEMSRSEKGSRP